MNRVLKIIVFVVGVFLFLFFIFRNITHVSNETRKLPTVEELQEFTSVISNSDVNTYEFKDISDKQLANIYYTDFKNEVLNNSEEVLKRIKNKDEITEDTFSNFRNNLINNYYTSKVVDYSIVNSTYKIENSEGITIVFYVDTGFKYDIELLF